MAFASRDEGVAKQMFGNGVNGVERWIIGSGHLIIEFDSLEVECGKSTGVGGCSSSISH